MNCKFISNKANDKMEKLKMVKQLDIIKKLLNKQVALADTPEVQEYLENKKMIEQLRSIVKAEVTEHLILKPSSFGMRKTFLEFADGNLTHLHIAKDKKAIQGILEGDKERARFKLTHKAPYEIKPSSILTIREWRNS